MAIAKETKTINWVKAIDISSLIRHYRLVNDMSQEELAEIIGTQQEAIARLERGRVLPSLTFLIKVAFALGKDLEIRFK